MLQICKFDKKRDVGKVIPGLFPDIEDLIVNHKVSDNSAQVSYNGIEEIADVGCRINDEFDAIVLSRLLRAGISDAHGHGSSQQAGSTAPTVTSNSGSNSGSSASESAG